MGFMRQIREWLDDPVSWLDENDREIIDIKYAHEGIDISNPYS